jgi:MraZ protein
MAELDFSGTYDCTVDDKGRIMFPSALKKRLQPVIDDGFMIKKSPFNKPCLEIFPRSAWLKMKENMRTLDPFQVETDDFIRRYMNIHKEVFLDGSGRFLIPKEMKGFGGINKEIILSCTVDKIEVWDKQKHDEEMNKPMDIGKLAKHVRNKSDN